MKQFLLIALLCVAAAGCAKTGTPLDAEMAGQEAQAEPGPAILAAPYHEHALYNFRLGRTYMAQGRYELARERYLLALSVSRNDELRQRLAEELDGVDRLLKTQR